MRRSYVLLVAAVVGVGFAGPPDEGCIDAPALGERCPDWVHTVDYPVDPLESANLERLFGSAASPDGRTVYFAGDGGGDRFVIVGAVHAVTGVPTWQVTVPTPLPHGNWTLDVAVSPDGAHVAVAGFLYDMGDGPAFVGVLSAATGDLLWWDEYGDPEDGDDRFQGVAFAGDVLIAAGIENGASGAAFGALVVGYDAATGQRRWVTSHRVDDPGRTARTEAFAVVAAPDGRAAYVLGYRQEASGGLATRDVAVWSVDPASGEMGWQHRHDGPASGYDRPDGIVLAGDGTVLVTSTTTGPDGAGATTLGLDPADGTARWSDRWQHADADWAEVIGIATSGSEVYVAGTYRAPLAAATAHFAAEYVTYVVAYDLADGSRRWVHETGAERRVAQTKSMAVSGDEVAVVRWTLRRPPPVTPIDGAVGVQAPMVDLQTLFVDRASGARRGLATYNTSPLYQDYMLPEGGVVAVEDGVVVVGSSQKPLASADVLNFSDGVLIAYR